MCSKAEILKKNIKQNTHTQKPIDKKKLQKFRVRYDCVECELDKTFNFLYLSHGYVGIRLYYRSMLSLSQATVLYKKKDRKGSCLIAQHKVLSFKYIPHRDDRSGGVEGCG